MAAADTTALLWLGVVAMGIYHGLNPAMGWPIAVANGLTAQRDRALLATLAPLGAGHLAAIAVVLVPFALLAWMVDWQREIRIGAGLLVLAFGLYRWFDRRHPRRLARIPPTRLAAWSFLMATAHGAALMLLPLTLGLCAGAPPGIDAAGIAALARSAAWTGLAVALVHTAAMLLSGLAIAWLVYRLLGLQFLKRVWFNLDAVWAASLVLAGAAGVGVAVGG